MAQWFGFSLAAVSIACSQRSPAVPKPAKQNGGQVGDHGSIWDSWPIAFSGYPRGPRVDWETARPRDATPSKPVETHSRTRVSRELLQHRQGVSLEMERMRSETLKLFVVSDSGRRSSLLSSTRSIPWWQSFVPRSAWPSLVACLWPAVRRRTHGTGLAWWKQSPSRP